MLAPVSQASELTLPSIFPPTQKPLELPAPQSPQRPPLQIEPAPLPFPELEQTEQISVHQFSFRGNKVLSTPELQKLTKPYLDRPLSFRELLELRIAINKAYQEQGYILAHVFIPASENQVVNPQNATLVIRCLEGTIESIEFEGAERFQRFIQARLHRSLYPAINETKLLDSLYFLRVDPALQDIRARITPSAEPGKYLLSLTYTPRFPIHANVELANDQTVSTGNFGQTLEMTALSPLSQGDQFQVSYFHTDGVQRIGVNYQIPINARGGIARLKSTFSNTAIVQYPFTLLDIASSSQIYEISVRQPLRRKVNPKRLQEFALGATVTHTDVQGTLLGFPFPLILGADNQGHSRDTVLSFFQDYQWLSSRRVFAARSTLKIGLPLAATLNAQPPDGEFFAWLGQAAFQQRLTKQWSFATRAILQLSDRQLFSFEHLPITGEYGVRGYPENAVLGDSGGIIQTELSFTPYAGRQGKVQISPFLDYGLPFSTVNTKQSLASVGLSLQYSRDYCTVRIILGVPLIPLSNLGDSLQEQGFIGGLQCGF